jgi:hypothetical protein
MDYVTAKEKSEEWGISLRRVQVFCEDGRIEGVSRMGKIWIIPKEAKKPVDGRTKAAKNEKTKRECSSHQQNKERRKND